jgi:hypothetical protein
MRCQLIIVKSWHKMPLLNVWRHFVWSSCIYNGMKIPMKSQANVEPRLGLDIIGYFLFVSVYFEEKCQRPHSLLAK